MIEMIEKIEGTGMVWMAWMIETSRSSPLRNLVNKAPESAGRWNVRVAGASVALFQPARWTGAVKRLLGNSSRAVPPRLPDRRAVRVPVA